MIDHVPRGRDTSIPIWVWALGLIVVGVILARLVRAALAPALRTAPVQFEFHVV